ncbi:double-cubane-cluster-containing anaerobic reductase [Maridesulfovibrio bastinii]|uniref:double-cubane-cluster-containing anaerobic reductase n=1 Tax=Maridesulfovibrio bastinii TaxID=47157 RepID=UPI0004246F54|nr:double-cubane-cluster-containing anaerobic reductase [Maridesulfovibrio bastinii]
MDLKFFTDFSEKSIAELDEWHEQGKKIAGIYCIYAPIELIRAAGVVPISLCGKKQTPIKDAEKDLPPALCPLIKSSYGFAVTESCPFFSFSDFIIAETTCDGKKKMYELMEKFKPVHLMHLPHTQNGTPALEYWKASLKSLEEFLYEQSGIKVSATELLDRIKEQNQIRKELWEIAVLAANERSPLTASEMLSVQESSSFSVYPQKHIEALKKLHTELEEFINSQSAVENKGLRILLTGCPVGKGSDKVIRITDDLGGRIVCMENCSGLKGMTMQVKEDGDPFEALAERYLQIPCSCMTPNENRFSSIKEMVETFRVEAVIDLTWTGCHTYNAESTLIGRFVEQELNLPFLHIETDYSESDIEQLRTRIEAFLELAS